MTGRLEQIWRYPVKSIGRERLDHVRLTRAERLPFDRHWAVLHETTLERLADQLGDGDEIAGWMPKSAFLRGAAGPGLQAVSGGLRGDGLALHHPDLGTITVVPHDPADRDRLIDWLRPIWPDDKPAPARLVSGPEALTDTRKPYVSINAIDSLNSIENLLGKRLGTERWRGNLWIEGFDPFAELNWIGKTIRIGEAELVVREPIGRCAATSVDTDTGAPDIDMVRTLTEANGQPHFGVYAEVTRGALIAELAEITLSDTDAEAITP
ncbi:MOSC domain-containing protein [Paracoccus xiamenensis]|uniref:MOSC domain-containing protein n=1 Tax=Paracoccus xiamenensis TaxID=2714901 RepID=UPI00140B4306|nr:MOSC N-terminal beta barrel domain-containing protein [Paracoccus xiamenensis]NHF73806.1 MOSC domain-containing protein [Paracoccus xiamenensis]